MSDRVTSRASTPDSIEPAPRKLPIKCLMDVTDLPPSAFAHPRDGRQRKHLCDLRKGVTGVLARYANSDGSSTYPAAATIAKSVGRDRATVFRLLQDLRDLGFLTDGKLAWRRGPRERTLHVGKMQAALEPDLFSVGVASSPSSESHLRNVGVASSRQTGPSLGPPSKPPFKPASEPPATNESVCAGGEISSTSSSPRDDVENKLSLERVLKAFIQSPVTSGKAKPCDRDTARKLLKDFTVEQIEYGILLAGSRRVSSFLSLDVDGREKSQANVQTLAYFANPIEEAAADPHTFTASYAQYCRHTLRQWSKLQLSKASTRVERTREVLPKNGKWPQRVERDSRSTQRKPPVGAMHKAG